jgi:hypothetical protein
VTGYALSGRGSVPDKGKRFFSTAFKSALGPIQSPMDTRDYFSGVKRPGCETDCLNLMPRTRMVEL